jgi:MoxR-like ATPase
MDFLWSSALALSSVHRDTTVPGEAGVGKTEVAKVMTEAQGGRLIRLQCYEGLDSTTALYKWNYPKHLLRFKMGESLHEPLKHVENIFSEEFLIRRPLLEAIRGEMNEAQTVLLIDEVDRADEEFEAFLLEILSHSWKKGKGGDRIDFRQTRGRDHRFAVETAQAQAAAHRAPL